MENKKSFEQLGLFSWIVESLKCLSIRSPTPVQSNCIPPILQGRDVIASAKTGSGKTAAFALPILQTLSQDPFGIYCLVLTPTRELAFQIAEQFRVLGNGINLKLVVVVGGMDMMQQSIELNKKPHVVIATPGRLADHIRSSSTNLSKSENSIPTFTIGNYFKRVKYLVLDEADRMLESTFQTDLELIVSQLPKQRQNLLFTATMTPEIESITFKPDNGDDSHAPFVYRMNELYGTVDSLDQRYIFIPLTVKDVYLSFLTRTDFQEKTMIIFTGKCKTAEHVRVMFSELGIRSTALHGLMNQNDRLSSLAKFKSGIVKILIATDVGSRGLDIPSVEVVINYEVPANPTDYIHRIGRTARAGRGGMSISFVSEKDVDIVLNIESKMDKKMEEYKVSESDALELMNEVGLAKRVASMQILDGDFGKKRKINMIKRGRIEK